MNTKKYLIEKVSALLILIIGLSGCMDEDLSSVPQQQGANSVLHLTFSKENVIDVNTRSTDKESVIKDLLVVIFRGNEALVESLEVSEEDSGSSVDVILKNIYPREGDKIYVFANTGATTITATNESDLYEEFSITNEIADPMQMFGEKIVDDPEVVNIDLFRPWAKAEITNTVKYSVTDWKVCNVPDAGYVSNFNGYPANTDLTEIDSRNGVAYFVPRKDNADNSTGLSEAKTCVLVHMADSSDVDNVIDKGWYKLDFYISAQKEYKNILPNTKYVFNILSIKSDGYTTEQEALGNSGSNIVYDMEIMDEIAVSNGQYTLLTTKDELVLNPIGGAAKFLVMSISAVIPSSSLNQITTYTIEVVDKDGKEAKNGPIKLVGKNDEKFSKINLLNPDEIELNPSDIHLTEANSKRNIYIVFDGADLSGKSLKIRLGNIVKNIPLKPISANSYIVNWMNENKTLFIPVIQANLDINTFNPVKEPRITNTTDLEMEILWSDNPVDLNMRYDKDKQWIEVSKKSDFLGNVVIAAIGKTDRIVKWSWHIWSLDNTVVEYNESLGIYDFKKSKIKNFNSYEWMDRNLGAYDLTPGVSGSYGLLYQWGRKDPFPGGRQSSEEPLLYCRNSTFKFYDQDHPTLGPTVVTNESTDNREYSIRHPWQFIKQMHYMVGNVLIYDWMTNNAEYRKNDLWLNGDLSKGVYNPCPYGWTLPYGGNMGPWASLWPTDGVVTNFGIDWSSGAIDVGYFPFCAQRIEGRLTDHLESMRYHWGDFSDERYSCTIITKNEVISLASETQKSFGQSVRCVKDSRK